MAKRKPELKVVFDTNVLFTETASDLVRADVSKLVRENSKHADLRVTWYLPQVVVDERRYQMSVEAMRFLPTVGKLERLLGLNLNITEDILDRRVDEAIEKNLDDLGLEVLALDHSRVPWQEIIRRATRRYSPFDPGEKEKGFRDAMIAESFLQLVNDSPSTPASCRLAIVSGDGRLAEYVEDQTKQTTNVRVLSNLNELESLINTLVSAVTEEFIQSISEKIGTFFFEKENDASLYYKEGIRERVKEAFGEELQSRPEGASARENGTWWIGEPVFVRKVKTRMYWMTPIKVGATAYKYVEDIEDQLGLRQALPVPDYLGGLGQSSGSLGDSDVQGIVKRVRQGQRRGLLGQAALTRKVKIAEGATNFEVNWSVNISQQKRLTSPKIESIECLGTSWEKE